MALPQNENETANHEKKNVVGSLLTRQDLDPNASNTPLAIRRNVGVGLQIWDVNYIRDAEQTIRVKYSVELAWTDELTEYQGADKVGWKPGEQGEQWNWRVGPRVLVVNTFEGADEDAAILNINAVDQASASTHRKDKSLQTRLIHRAEELIVDLDFRWFPFDRQILPIEFRALGSRYKASKGSFPIKPMGFLLSKSAKRLAEWNVSCHSAVYREDLGDTYGVYSTLTFYLQADRTYTSHFVNLMVLPFVVSRTVLSGIP